MPLKILILLSILVFSSYGVADQVLLTEKKLMTLASDNTPSLMALDAQQAGAQAALDGENVKYDSVVSMSFNYDSSRENAIMPFALVFQPQTLAQAMVQKKLTHGIAVQAGVFGQQMSTADRFIDNATQVGTRVGVEFDLWKNFLGRIDRSEYQSTALQKEITELQTNVSRKNYFIEIRKAYWSLVANELSSELSQELIKTAERQYRQARKQVQEGVGDRGDVQRSFAQVQARKTSLLQFEYQKENLLTYLRAMIPKLPKSTITVDAKNIVKTEEATLMCLTSILSLEKVNDQHSSLGTIISKLGDQKKWELKKTEAVDDIDVKLVAEYQASGVDNKYSKAVENYSDDYRDGYKVGLQVQIPLGSQRSNLKKSQLRATQARLDAESYSLRLQLDAEHKKIREGIRLLKLALDSQSKTVQSLNLSLNSTKRKYQQARVPLNTYILEQDNLFNTKLLVINTRLQILHLLLDYFKVFTNHPCPLNQMSEV